MYPTKTIMPIAKIVPGKAYPVAEIRDKFCNFLSPESFATEAQMVLVDITNKDPKKDTSNVFFSIKRLSTVLDIVIEDITFAIKMAIGIKKPKHTGMIQMKRKSIDIDPVIFVV